MNMCAVIYRDEHQCLDPPPQSTSEREREKGGGAVHTVCQTFGQDMLHGYSFKALSSSVVLIETMR